MRLDPARRTDLAQRILRNLEAAAPGSVADLRGSLASGCADEYSDIDVRWTLPASAFQSGLDRLRATLAAVQPVASLRVDPDVQTSPIRRLCYVRFEGVLLFWRLDLDIVAEGTGAGGADTPLVVAGADPWLPAESALANAVAAVKALRRGRDDLAGPLLARAYARLGLDAPGLPGAAVIVQLAGVAAEREPALAGLAEQVRQFVAEALPSPPTRL